MSRQTLSAIENDKYDPNLTLAFHLSFLFGEPVEVIFDKSDFLDTLDQTSLA